jgi:hypothetical protein
LASSAISRQASTALNFRLAATSWSRSPPTSAFPASKERPIISSTSSRIRSMTGSSQNIQPAHRGWRRDHRRTIALCGGWPRADSAQRSEDLRGLVRLWPGGDREVSRAGDGGSLTIFSSGVLIFNRANIGLSISAGVENRGMVDALGAAVVRRCVHVGFGAGSAGRTMMSLYCGQVHGSVGSCGYKHHHRQLGVGRRMVHRLDPGCSHRPGFLVRKLAPVSNILAMVAVLLWRPRGLDLVLGFLQCGRPSCVTDSL